MPRFTEKSVVEDYFINKLQNLGWRFIPADELDRESLEEPLLTNNLLRALNKLNANIGISAEEIKQVLNELKLNRRRCSDAPPAARACDRARRSARRRGGGAGCRHDRAAVPPPAAGGRCAGRLRPLARRNRELAGESDGPRRRARPRDGPRGRCGRPRHRPGRA